MRDFAPTTDQTTCRLTLMKKMDYKKFYELLI